MGYSRILITGGAGFVGSSLGLMLKRHHPSSTILALDNLKRRGSELSLSRLKQGGVEFHHGDVRSPEDLEALGGVDLLIDCSAEPSVHAGYGQSPNYLVNTNLTGMQNCLEYLRRFGGELLFLSTSRVYPIAGLSGIPLERRENRLALPPDAAGPGWSAEGISEGFPLHGARSLYGTTKLASEMLIEEYRAMYGLKAAILRCGVLAGPWQMGKVDQGFVVLWMARHLYGGRLSYSGFGGHGLQVRDVLHVEDLGRLVMEMLGDFTAHDGTIRNVGGGAEVSTSLRELTSLCVDITGQKLEIGSDPATRPADVPYYVSDCSTLQAKSDWRPRRRLPDILDDICRWLVDHRASLEPVLGH